MDPVLSRPARLPFACALAAAVCGRGEPALGQDYRIDPLASEIHVLVRRAGPLARLGHNHVVAAHDITGRVMRGPTLEGSTAQIQLLVDRLTVDAASLRARYGEDFASTPSEDDIAGTTANMLGEALLDAATHPQIRIAAVLSSGPAGFVIDADIDIKSRVWHGSIPLELEIVDDVLVAHGSTVITHEALGLEPFSVILGALRVANEIEIRFSLTARR